MQSSPPFQEALAGFKNFLRTQGLADTLRWIWRDAIISRRYQGSRRSASRPIYIDLSRVAGESEIEAYYDLGVTRGFGISLRVLCVSDGQPCCFIDLPKDKTDAEHRMISSLNCKMPTPLPDAKAIRSRQVATFLRFFQKNPSTAWWLEDVPLPPDGAVARAAKV